MRIFNLVCLASLAVLTSCTTAPIQQDQPILLGKDAGLAAIVINTTYPMNNILVQPAGTGGNALKVPYAPTGRTLYLFQTQAGNYCLDELHFGSLMFYGKGADVVCFAVPAGQIGYSGDLQPSVKDGRIVVNQNYDFDSFHDLLKHDYPKIAAQFQPAPPAGLPTSTPESSPTAPAPLPIPVEKPNCDLHQQVCSWAETPAESRSQSIFIRNNTQWPILVTAMQLYGCINVRQACTVRQVKIELSPHASKKVFVVDPANPDGAYAYQFRYEYRFEID
ncbi:MAG: hypothetical protein WBR15_08805 [Gammaproteobacteria bacterium]